MTPSKLGAWKNYFEQKATSSSNVGTVSYGLKGLNYLKDTEFKTSEQEKPQDRQIFQDSAVKASTQKDDKIKVTLESLDPSLNVYVIVQKQGQLPYQIQGVYDTDEQNYTMEAELRQLLRHRVNGKYEVTLFA